MNKSFDWPLINNNISDSDKKELIKFIESSDRFTNGQKVKEFEEIWSKWLGVKRSVMVNSGTSGNFISIAMVKELLGMGEIIVPPLGWVSDVSSIVQLGMTPVFVDICLENLSITAYNIQQAINENTKAIVLVHCLGFNALNQEILKLAKQHNIMIIEDCCESHGACYRGQKVGSFGDISVFSFFFGHHITTIEGGMVCVNDDKLYDLARLFRSHGMTRETSNENQEFYKTKYPHLNPQFTFAVPGFNFRSTELNAVLGIQQMKRIDYNVRKRKHNFEVWLRNLDKKKYLTHFFVGGNSNFALPLIILPPNNKNLPYSTVMRMICNHLESRGVEYRLGTSGGGNQTLQPYLEKYNHKIIGDLRMVNYIHNCSLYIGNHTDLTDEKIINLCEELNSIYDEQYLLQQ